MARSRVPACGAAGRGIWGWGGRGFAGGGQSGFGQGGARQACDVGDGEIGALPGFGQGAVAPVGVEALEAGEQVVEMVSRRGDHRNARAAPRRDPCDGFTQAGQD